MGSIGMVWDCIEREKDGLEYPLCRLFAGRVKDLCRFFDIQYWIRDRVACNGSRYAQSQVQNCLPSCLDEMEHFVEDDSPFEYSMVSLLVN